jgi:5-methylcytosine-specific restriction endonuclease McrA
MRSRKTSCSCGRIIPKGTRCPCKVKAKRDYMRQYQRNDKNNPLKTTRWNKLRKNILSRDKYLCQRCLHKYNTLNSSELQAHHIKSRKNYPELVFEERNILTLCKTCNLQLGTKDKLDFELRQDLSTDQK